MTVKALAAVFFVAVVYPVTVPPRKHVSSWSVAGMFAHSFMFTGASRRAYRQELPWSAISFRGSSAVRRIRCLPAVRRLGGRRQRHDAGRVQGGMGTFDRYQYAMHEEDDTADLTFRTPSRGYSSLRGALGGGGPLRGSERGGPRGRCSAVSNAMTVNVIEGYLQVPDAQI